MKMSSAGFLALVLLVTCSEAEPATEFAEASEGSTASLPCSLAPTHPPDKVSVVLWYRGALESPIYKYDLRSGRPQHWADSVLDNRYFLKVLDEDRAVMSITPTKLEDEEMYHCRVDFHRSPTRITHVNLTIVGECRIDLANFMGVKGKRCGGEIGEESRETVCFCASFASSSS